jgi:hypothetical protein
MAVDPCQIVDTLAAANLEIMRRVNRKFAALRNLAQLLSQLGEVSELVPNIGRLIPVVNIDIQVYTDMQAACPYLNLPPYTTGSLNALQAQVTTAYANMVAKLLNHPWNRMGKLQEEMNQFLLGIQSNIDFGLQQSQNFLLCLQTVCAAGKAVAGQLNAFSNADIGKEITTFANNFAANGGKVLTEGMEAKYEELQSMQRELIALGADTKMDYADAKAALGN